ncbi:flavin reductase [Jatrophihabitans telluris]|uniref:Flavin reductase n=1 Tax=Jatrophihabitans telluris TaxID=2038343 RepID=A0ABY4R147_9ACTN|nr:flavin reductase [Jatrophihabitans telluris]UQX88971.1 flavin reductase [Jatrophihabitans telluris]
MKTGPDERIPEVDPADFRHVVSHLASGVSVITTITGDNVKHGITASSVTSLSTDPPMMLICLHNLAPTSKAVSRAGVYVVNVLGQGHASLAAQFATPSENKFRGVETVQGVTGAPLLVGALAHIECRVVEEVTGGTHTIFLGRVARAKAEDGHPLTYYRGGFGRFEFARDDEVYQRARQWVIDRRYFADSVIDAGQLSFDLNADESAAFYALTRLSSEGLVRRDPDRGYVVVPLDSRLVDETFDARCAIEVGVINTSLQLVTDDDLAQLRRSFDAMCRQLTNDRFVDFDKYLEANYGFHKQIVMLARNSSLNVAFRQLAIKSVMTRSFGSTRESSQQFLDAQRRLLDAIEARDATSAESAAIEYRELAKVRAHKILSQTGGLL